MTTEIIIAAVVLVGMCGFPLWLIHRTRKEAEAAEEAWEAAEATRLAAARPNPVETATLALLMDLCGVDHVHTGPLVLHRDGRASLGHRDAENTAGRGEITEEEIAQFAQALGLDPDSGEGETA